MSVEIRPRTCGQCRFRFDDGSCRIHRDVVAKPGGRACGQGLRPESPPAPPSLFDEEESPRASD